MSIITQQNLKNNSIAIKISQQLFVPMSTKNKVVKTSSSAFALIAGTTLLVAGAKSLGTASIVIGGAALGLSPVGACIIGGALAIAAIAMMVKLTCASLNKANSSVRHGNSFDHEMGIEMQRTNNQVRKNILEAKYDTLKNAHAEALLASRGSKRGSPESRQLASKALSIWTKLTNIQNELNELT